MPRAIGQEPCATRGADDVLQAREERWESLVGEFWGAESGGELSAVLRRMEEYVLVRPAPAMMEHLPAEILQMASQKRAMDEVAWKQASAAFGGLMRAVGRVPSPTMPVMATPIADPAADPCEADTLDTGVPTVVVGSILQPSPAPCTPRPTRAQVVLSPAGGGIPLLRSLVLLLIVTCDCVGLMLSWSFAISPLLDESRPWKALCVGQIAPPACDVEGDECVRCAVAIGQVAHGVVAVGQIAQGVVAIGQASISLVTPLCMVGFGVLFFGAGWGGSCGLSMFGVWGTINGNQRSLALVSTESFPSQHAVFHMDTIWSLCSCGASRHPTAGGERRLHERLHSHVVDQNNEECQQ